MSTPAEKASPVAGSTDDGQRFARILASRCIVDCGSQPSPARRCFSRSWIDDALMRVTEFFRSFPGSFSRSLSLRCSATASPISWSCSHSPHGAGSRGSLAPRSSRFANATSSVPPEL
jgi:hypothetical protein